MAIDTENKRRSSVGVSTIGGMFPVPDGTIDQADRQTVTWVYSGILAGAAVSFLRPNLDVLLGGADVVVVLVSNNVDVTVPSTDLGVTVPSTTL